MLIRRMLPFVVAAAGVSGAAAQSAADVTCPEGAERRESAEDARFPEVFCVRSGADGKEVRHGPSLRLTADGKRAELQGYRNGERHGRHVVWYPNGRRALTEQFRQGQRQGAFKEWWPDGKKRTEGEFVKDKRHGAWTTWLRNGEMVNRVLYKRGKPIEPVT